MKLTAFLILATCLQLSAEGFSQTITLSEKNVSLEKIFTEIKKQTGYDFFYESKLLKQAGVVNIQVNNAALEEVLTLLFKDKPLTYSIVEKTILVKEKSIPPTVTTLDSSPPLIIIKGRVVDDKSGEPVSDASVMIRGARIGISTGRDGEFSFTYDGGKDNIVLVISHIGYMEKQVAFKNEEYITVRLAVTEQSLANVEVSMGIYKRRKESFTGATATFSGDQLKAVGNNNIIQSLKTLDPSFIVVENNRLGSNPNKLPAIELRGKTSINLNTTDLNNQFSSDPNLPLFILNGFPTTLAIINNLDMNRVASVTVLKDAASTAMWGSKAANGVVVVETKKPIAGELRVTYNADLTIDAPDLSSYNLMTAEEKLQFEKLAGFYTEKYFVYQYDADRAYDKRLADVKRGVNTYWLNEPVQTGFTNGHSLQMTGGNRDLLFGAGVSFKDQEGVMKGSDHRIWGANVDLTYRKGKFNIGNQLYISGENNKESPYGAFSNYAQASPLQKKNNPDGTIPKYGDSATLLGANPIAPSANPLFNASLFSINRTDNFNINNNLQGIFTINPNLWLQGGFQLTKGSISTVVFISPGNTAFDGSVSTEKGSYMNTQVKTSSYTGNLTLTYAKIFAGAHMINANLRSEINEQSRQSVGFKAIGFPEGTNGNPAYAFKYDPYSTPPTSTVIVRSVNATGSLNYAFRSKYLLDAVYTVNGSNAFGSDHKIAPSWSVGAGWNLHKERFFSKYQWLNLLKLRGDIGVSGNENLGAFSSNSVYTALAGSNLFGQSLQMTGLGVPNLQWQSTRSVSTGLEVAVLNNRISAVINYYEKTTNPLIVSATGILPSSVGVNFSYPQNVGELTYKGWELNLRISPVYHLKERIVWTIGLTGARATGKYDGLGKSLDEANKEQLQSNGLVRYQDGYSPDDIWAVRSVGIDPATGAELFQKRDGTLTFLYNADDIVNIGNSRPAVEGVISSNFNYKGFFANVAFRYQVGGYMLNSALYDKVENIGFGAILYNQDKRALYDRWQKPGDITQFKNIADDTYTPMSSRFIQKSSLIEAESISIGWDFTGNNWIKKLGMQGLRIYAYTNNLFRISTIQTERGLDYPFARSYSVTVSASF